MNGPRQVAIVGIAGRFPGANDVATLWDNLTANRSATRDVAAAAWPVPPEDILANDATGLVDHASSPRACALDPFTLDPTGLHLPPEWLPRLSRLAQLTLQVGADAWRSTTGARHTERTSVILANIALPTDGASKLAEDLFLGPADRVILGTPAKVGEPLDAFPSALPAGLLARALGLGGGTFTLDAACASSLYAVHLACADLEAGRVDAVICGGVSLPQSLYTQVGFTQLLALSASGRAAPYDETADGLVVGEGAAMVVLKRLDDAQRDGDRVLAVVRGVGLSNDVGGSLLSPESEGQLRAMRTAYAEAGWQPDDVDLIEGHGTGTPRGDAVELASLAELWRGLPPRGAVLGSVKSNIGHLLTAAGAAALCKVVLALGAKTLPPSANASRPTRALRDGPFRVLSAPEPWPAPPDGRPRRAAVSGFGFGGINAHLLLEEATDAPPPSILPRSSATLGPIAIVGLAAHFGSLDSLGAFRDAVFAGTPLADALPKERWHGLDRDASSTDVARLSRLRGGWLDVIELAKGRFRLPPRDVPALLPQQLLMLKVAGAALEDAGHTSTEPQLRMGAVVGLGLDLESTSFHLRWLARARVRRWAAALGLTLGAAEAEAWSLALKEALAPALDATRTLGALGGIVPSRVAREFHLGGPSFAVADDQASGLRALEVAVRLLERREVDAMLVGAVDLAGDVRAVLAMDHLRPFAPDGQARPFDVAAHGAKVGEGAAALVLKRLDDAVAAGDRIYAVVRGVAASGAGALDFAAGRCAAYVRAARAAHAEARIDANAVGLVAAHGSGVPSEDSVEARALSALFPVAAGAGRTAVTSTSAIVGQAGAAAGLASLVTTALALHHRVVPPQHGLETPTDAIDWGGTSLHLPRAPEAWLRNREAGPRVAVAAAMGMSGSCVHVVLAEHEAPTMGAREHPVGRGAALFLLRGERGGEAEGAALVALAGVHRDLEDVARAWYAASRSSSKERVTRAIVANDLPDLLAQLARAQPSSAALGGSVAVVFPGSGNHYVGMGRGLALALPEVYARLDAEVLHLESQLQPAGVAPRRTSWPATWEEDASRELDRHPERVIVAQVAHGIAVHDALVYLGLRPTAYIGYSLGESTALFASRTWRERDVMFQRTLDSPLFRTELCGAQTVMHEAWGPAAEWSVVVVNRPASLVRAALVGTAALLIVNAPRECVVGGRKEDVTATVAFLRCESLPLASVPTVHLPLAAAVRDSYRAHHLLKTTRNPDVRVYSGAWAKAYEPTAASAAESIVANAVDGFDFPRVIEQAWEDGVRSFVEAGPQGSCTRMIGRILAGRPHLAVSACQRGSDGYRGVLTAIARVAEAGARVDLEALYGGVTASPTTLSSERLPPVIVGGIRADLPLRPPSFANALPRVVAPALALPAPESSAPDLAPFFAAAAATAHAHATFLQVSQKALALQTRLTLEHRAVVASDDPLAPDAVPPRFDRTACLEFATGKLSRVLGPAFADVDAFATRVRLPAEPLMLVDRIVLVEGESGVLGPGRVVTEHDVHEGAWYLDGGRAPVCISVEAGQADLFLSSYLGIDREARGERVYRLLDAKIVFHRDLPRAGERIRYDIRIDRFIQQGDTWLFFFRFDGAIDGQPFITMYEGCAGFFSPEQLRAGAGIVPRSGANERAVVPTAVKTSPFEAPLAVTAGSLADAQVDALRDGDLEAAFGARFAGKNLTPSLRLPTGRMKLVDRILAFDLRGGAAGLGEVTGEADIRPDAWFLTCHFIDDQVMPGTLMYECCLHTLRVLLLRLGWVSTDPTKDLHYGPIPGASSELRCRGQVTASTKRVRYRVTIEEIGYGPEAYVRASASMFADEKHVVQMDGMSVVVRGMTLADVAAEWAAAPRSPAPAFSREQVVAYAEGNPSECFGAPYRPFDHDRRLARLPRDPFLFVDRVVSVEPPPWVLEPGGWVTCEFDVDPDAWYFGASQQRTMPFVVLLEAALQPCGWLAAYLGSALLSDVDLKFRNLDGHGTQRLEVTPDTGTLTTRARLTKTSRAGGMILQEFELVVLAGAAEVYVGQTGFGFFPAEALAAQVGLRGAEAWSRLDAAPGRRLLRSGAASPNEAVGVAVAAGLALPQAALSMIDVVTALDVAGGPRGLGFIAGTKRVDPDEWFFRAHFYQDPVMPGSLGLEAVLELLKVFARERFPECVRTHRFQSMATGQLHRWQYRGQVVPTNREVRVEVRLTELIGGDEPLLVAAGQLSVDGKIIYGLKDFAIRLVREAIE